MKHSIKELNMLICAVISVRHNISGTKGFEKDKETLKNYNEFGEMLSKLRAERARLKVEAGK